MFSLEKTSEKENNNYLNRVKELPPSFRRQFLAFQFSNSRNGFKFWPQTPTSCMNTTTVVKSNSSFVKGAFYYLYVSGWFKRVS